MTDEEPAGGWDSPGPHDDMIGIVTREGKEIWRTTAMYRDDRSAIDLANKWADFQSVPSQPHLEDIVVVLKRRIEKLLRLAGGRFEEMVKNQ